MTSDMNAAQPKIAPCEDSMSTLVAKVESALRDYKSAKGSGWRRESDASKRLSKALTRMVNSQIGPDLEARLVLYPVMQKDKDDEEKVRRQELEEKSKSRKSS